MIVRCIVAGMNSESTPDFYACSVECDEDAYEVGEHYISAREQAEQAGFQGELVVFDEFDAPDWLVKRFFKGTADENLNRWRDSGEAHRWVWGRSGKWDHDDWSRLLDTLRKSSFWPMSETDIGQTLEDLKKAYLDLARWGMLHSNEGGAKATMTISSEAELVAKIKELELDLEDKQGEMDVQSEDYEELVQWHKNKVAELTSEAGNLRTAISHLELENQRMTQGVERLLQQLEAAGHPVVKRKESQKSGPGFWEFVLTVMDALSGETMCRGCLRKIKLGASRCPYCTEYQ